MTETQELIPAQQTALVRDVRAEDFLPVLTVQQAIDRKTQMNEFIKNVLKEGEDYGPIPGGQQKKVLLKPGAEKLSSIFGLSPRYVKEVIVEDWTGEDHGGEPLFSYEYRCQLYRGDRFLGEAIGSCNTWETKYRYRNANRKCPSCGLETIIVGKAEYGGGFLCFKKKGGCGQKFPEDDADILSQSVGRVSNPDMADLINTVQKMAQKRALVAAVLVVTNCSDAFSQDVGDPEDDGVRRTSEPEHKTEEHYSQESEVNEIPKELQEIVKNISKKGYVSQGFSLLLDRLKAAMPEYGETEYRRILADNNIIKNQPIKAGPAKNAMLQLWKLIEFTEKQKAEAAKARATAVPFEVSDEDVPFFEEDAKQLRREELAK